MHLFVMHLYIHVSFIRIFLRMDVTLYNRFHDLLLLIIEIRDHRD